MCNPTDALARAHEYSRRWGIIVVASPCVGFGWRKHVTDEGPYRGGINWPLRAIIFPAHEPSPDALLGSALMHEISHILVGAAPEDVDEVRSAMLALDFYGHRLLRLSSWKGWMENYLVGNRPYWDIPPLERRDLIAASLEQAVLAGLLDEHGLPTFNRAAWAPKDVSC